MSRILLGVTFRPIALFLTMGVLAGCADNGADQRQAVELAAPTEVKAVAGDAKVTLTWTVADSTLRSKVVRSDQSGGPYQEVATVPGATETDASVENGKTYFYAVQSVNAKQVSEFSPEVSATPQRQPLAAPSGLVATVVNASQLHLAWTDSSNGANGFQVERKTTAGGGFVVVATLGKGVTQYADVGLQVSTLYYYRLRAYNAFGYSLYTNETNATTDAGPSISGVLPSSGGMGTLVTVSGNNFGASQGTSTVSVGTAEAAITSWSATSIVITIPSVPGGVQSVSVNANGASFNAAEFQVIATPEAPSDLLANAVSSTRINLAWVDHANNEDGFKVERKTGAGGEFVVVATLGANSTYFNDTGLLSGTEYSYRVFAHTTVGSSPFSNVAVTTTTAGPGITGLMPNSGKVGASIVIGGSGFGTTQGASTVTVGGTAAVVSTWSSNSIQITIPSLALGSQNVVVTVANIASNGAAFQVIIVPAAPSSLGAIAVSSSQINLTWTDNANNEDGFRVDRKTGLGGTYALVATAGAGATSYNDIGLTSATQYYYRIFAFNNAGNSFSSLVTNATTQIGPNITGMSPASGLAGASIALSGNNFGAIQWLSTVTVGGMAASISAWSQTSIIITIPALAPGSYSVVVTVDGVASNGRVFQVMVAPLAPSNLQGAAASSTRIDLTWTDGSNNEDGFKVERKTGAGGTYAVVVTLASGTAGYSNTGLAPATLYYYRVYAFNAFGNSPNSNEINATTIAGPAISELTPAAGIVGASVTIGGSNFGSTQGSSTVSVGGTAASVISWSSTSIVIAIPNVAGGSRSVVVTVNTIASTGSTFQVIVAPLAPANLVATAVSSTQIGLVWTDIATTEDGYKVERKTGAGGTYAVIATLGPNAYSHESTGLTAATLYYYRVFAYNIAGNSGNSNEANETSQSVSIMGSSPTSATSLDTVVLTGINFGTLQGTVTVEGVSASIISWSNTSVSIQVPGTINPGLRTTALVNAAGQPSTTIFLTVLPHLASITPDTATGGDLLTITGTNLGALTGGVTIGGVAATPLSWTTSSVTVPLSAQIPAGSQNVVVTAVGQMSNTLVLSVRPNLSTVSPANGPNGALLSLSGSNFGTSPGTVEMGGVGAAVKSWANTSITVLVPNAILAGTQSVVVTAGGQSSAAKNFSVEISIWLTPMAPKAVTGSTVTFAATISGSSSQAVAWTVGEAGSTISAGGVYTVPVTPGTYHVAAASIADPSINIATTVRALAVGVASIPAACFNMGDSPGDGAAYERPIHNVCIGEIEMDKKEVSNKQYKACVTAGGCPPPSAVNSLTRNPYYGNPAYADYPVVFVDWKKANGYCMWASKRLPTEAEWEFAARGGLAGKRFPTGDTFDCSKANVRHAAGYAFDTQGGPDAYCMADTVTGGTYPANGYGLSDMDGNVEEWVNDWFDPAYYAISPANDPQGPAFAASRGIRGGLFFYISYYARTSFRTGTSPSTGTFFLGFRCVQSTAPPAAPSLLTAVAISTSEVELTWSDNTKSENGYKIERKAGALGTYAVIVTLPSNSIRYYDKALAASTLYYYRVHAFNKEADSATSNEANATTQLPPAGAMASISTGCFTMGDKLNDTAVTGELNEKPIHNVCLSSFAIDVKEVSNAQYKACVTAGGCTIPLSTTSFTRATYYDDAAYDTYPVVHVSWTQAEAYCGWASKRLPTEAQWEYAARGGLDGDRFPWGASIACSNANYRTSSTYAYDIEPGSTDVYCVGDTAAGGSYAPNAYGLYDMAGNVSEWIRDWHSETYYQVSPSSNPTGPATGTENGIRGGSFDLFANDLRLSRRRAKPPTGIGSGDYSLGFRCVR